MTIVLTPSAVVANPDYTTFSAYLDSQGLIFHQEGSTVPVPLQAQRIDTGNPRERRPESGLYFSQGDFSGGMHQRYAHHPGSDDNKCFYLDGFDNSEPGKLTHLNKGTAVTGLTAISSGRLAVAQPGGTETLFVTKGATVHRTTDLSSFNSEDPLAGEAVDQTHDLIGVGQRVFVALGTNGVHFRNNAGTWAHLETSGAVDLNTGDTRLLLWARATRLIVVGGAGVTIYEVILSGDNYTTSTALETLPAGWSFTALWEQDGFIYAGVHTPEGARVHHYGLDSAGTALEPKGATPMAVGERIFSGLGYLGQNWIGVTRLRKTAPGLLAGADAVVYQAQSSDSGFLENIQIVAEVKSDSSANLLPRPIVPSGNSILFGCQRDDSGPDGSWAGLMQYNAARGALSQFLTHERDVANADLKEVNAHGLVVFSNRLVWLADDTIYKEDLGVLEATAMLTTARADWLDAGNKIHATIELVTDPLPADTSVAIYYSTVDPDENSWTLAGTHNTLNATTKLLRLTDNVEAPAVALRFVSTANTAKTAAPVIRSFTLRADPKPSTPEWRLTRYPRFMEGDRLTAEGEVQWWNPRTEFDSLRLKQGEWVTWTEPGDTYTARVVAVSAVRPEHPVYDTTTGEAVKDAIYAEVILEGVLA